MNKKTELSAEAQAMYDIYWRSVNRGGNVAHMWQEMVDTALEMNYAKLRGMEQALVDMQANDYALLKQINDMLAVSNGIVDKNVTWHHKERAKLLKNKAKLKLKIAIEKNRLTELP